MLYWKNVFHPSQTMKVKCFQRYWSEDEWREAKFPNQNTYNILSPSAPPPPRKKVSYFHIFSLYLHPPSGVNLVKCVKIFQFPTISKFLWGRGFCMWWKQQIQTNAVIGNKILEDTAIRLYQALNNDKKKYIYIYIHI